MLVLAQLGDESVIGRVDELVRSGVRGRELRYRLFVLAVLGTPRARAVLDEYRRSSDEELASSAERVARQHPPGWPIDPFARPYY